MVPKNSKFSACNLRSTSLHIASNPNQAHEGYGVSHAKSHMPKVPIKLTVFWKKRLADWWESEPSDGSKSPSSTSSKCHVADSRIASFTKMLIFPLFFYVFSCGAMIPLLACKEYLTWHEKLLKMPFWLILLLAAATSVVGSPKKADFLPLQGPHLGRREAPWDGLSLKASLHVGACIPLGFMTGC